MFTSILITLIFLLSGNSAEKKVENYLAEKLSGYDKYEFELVKAPVGDFEFSTTEANNFNGGLNYLPVKIKSKNGGVINSYLTIRLKLYKEIFVVKNDISNKQTINPKDLELQLFEITNLRGNTISSFSELEGMRSKMLLREGTVLFKESLETDPIIKNGDWLIASTFSGNVAIEVDAEAKQEGCRGDIIKILTKDKKYFKAKVIDSNNVIILE